MLIYQVYLVRTKASVKKFPAKRQRDSHAVLPVDKLAILQSTAPNAESQALNRCLRRHILLADLIISQIAVIINHEIASHADVLRNCVGGYHEMIIDICHSTGCPSSKYEHRRTSALLRNMGNVKISTGKKPTVSLTYENEGISITNS